MTHRSYTLRLPKGELRLGEEPVVMGILNTTPDSFSDGGDNFSLDDALSSAEHMKAEGAGILDVGGESTRPGAEEVTAQQELDRVMPILDAFRGRNYGLPISIDTYKAVVADQAIEAGAVIINDVCGFQRDPEIADVAAAADVPVIAMHWDLKRDRDKDLITEMARYFDQTLMIADKAGIPKDRIVLDPGFGFGKTFEENYVLLNRLDELLSLGFPMLIGTSRKSMLGKLLGVPPKDRLAATVATSVLAYLKGGHIFRVHDVRANLDGLAVARATRYGAPPPLEV
jgi:dihydropteroate synthase